MNAGRGTTVPFQNVNQEMRREIADSVFGKKGE
jgi:hypothetical protein